MARGERGVLEPENNVSPAADYDCPLERLAGALVDGERPLNELFWGNDRLEYALDWAERGTAAPPLRA